PGCEPRGQGAAHPAVLEARRLDLQTLDLGDEPPAQPVLHPAAMNTRVAAVAELERRIGHAFVDRDLLERALTHGSVTKGSAKIRDNERLEFLGDRVLNLAVAEQLMRLRPNATEG